MVSASLMLCGALVIVVKLRSRERERERERDLERERDSERESVTLPGTACIITVGLSKTYNDNVFII